MEGFIVIVLLQLFSYILGCRTGYFRGRIDAARDLIAANDEINQTLRLAEMRGVDTSKLTPDEVIQMTMQRRLDLEKKERDRELP